MAVTRLPLQTSGYGFQIVFRLEKAITKLLPHDGFLAIWYNHPMKAKLIFHEKVIFSGGAILEMVLWELPEKTKDQPHGLKYRLHYGLLGKTLVRYDNEQGKGDQGMPQS